MTSAALPLTLEMDCADVEERVFSVLAAPVDRETCAPHERPRYEATVHRLVEDARARMPGVSREEFMDALSDRYREFRRIQLPPAKLPPKA